MIKYFYLVKFTYITNENFESNLDLGIFSSKRKANEKIELSKKLPGFKEYDFENFQIIKFGVDFEYDIKNKSNISLFCVTHEYEDEINDICFWNIFDYFSSIEKAKSKIEHLKKHSRVGKKYPNNFDIFEIKVDNFNSWSEGFDELNK